MDDIGLAAQGYAARRERGVSSDFSTAPRAPPAFPVNGAPTLFGHGLFQPLAQRLQV